MQNRPLTRLTLPAETPKLLRSYLKEQDVIMHHSKKHIQKHGNKEAGTAMDTTTTSTNTSTSNTTSVSTRNVMRQSIVGKSTFHQNFLLL